MDSQDKNDLEAELALLSQALQMRARRLVRRHLVSTRLPLSCRDISEAIGLPLPTVAAALLDLLANDRVKDVGVNAAGAILFRPVEVGRCEWCGVVSHHLVAGECPDHRAPIH